MLNFNISVSDQQIFSNVAKSYYSAQNDTEMFKLPQWFNTNKCSSISSWLVAHFEKRIVHCYFNRDFEDMRCSSIGLCSEYERIWRDLTQDERDHLIEKSVDELDHFKKESYNNFTIDAYYFQPKRNYINPNSKQIEQIIRDFNWDEVILKLIVNFNDMKFNENITDYTRFKFTLKMLIKKLSHENKQNFILFCVNPNLEEAIKIEKFFMNIMVKYLHDLYIQKNINELIDLEKNNEYKKSKNHKKKNKKKRIRNKKKYNGLTTPLDTLTLKDASVITESSNFVSPQLDVGEDDIGCDKVIRGSVDDENDVVRNEIEVNCFETDSIFEVKTQKLCYYNVKDDSDIEKISMKGNNLSDGQRSDSEVIKTMIKNEFNSEKYKIKSFHHHHNKETKNYPIKLFNAKIEEKEGEEILINDKQNEKDDNYSKSQTNKQRKYKSLKKMKKFKKSPSFEYKKIEIKPKNLNYKNLNYKNSNYKNSNYKYKLKKSKKNKISQLASKKISQDKSCLNNFNKKTVSKKLNSKKNNHKNIEKWVEEKPVQNIIQKKDKKIQKSENSKLIKPKKKTKKKKSQILSSNISPPIKTISKWNDDDDESQPIIFNKKKPKKKLKLTNPFTINSNTSNFFSSIHPNFNHNLPHTYNNITHSTYPYYFQNNMPIPLSHKQEYQTSIFSQIIPNTFNKTNSNPITPINESVPFYIPENKLTPPPHTTNNPQPDNKHIQTNFCDSQNIITKHNETDSNKINKSETDQKNPKLNTIQKSIFDKKSEIIDLNKEAFDKFTEKSVKKIVNDVQNKTNSLNIHRSIILKRINKIVHKSFKTDQVNVIPYGSFETGLLTPDSDLDLAITFSSFNNISYEDKSYFLETLANNLKLFVFVLKTDQILTATVPLIKIEADASIEFKDLPEKTNESKVIKVDIIVGSNEANGDINTAFTTTNYIKHAIQVYPSFFEVNLFFKYILTTHKLSNAFNGGFNSYGLSIFIIAFLHSFNYTESIETGKIVIELLNFISNTFLPYSTIVDLNFCKLPNHQPFLQCEPFITGGQLYIVDPTSAIQKNITSSCSRIYQIQSFLSQCHERILSVQQFMKIKLLKKFEETLNKEVSSENRFYFPEEDINIELNDQNSNNKNHEYSLQNKINNSLKSSNFEQNENFSNKISNHHNNNQNQIEVLSQDNHKKPISKPSLKIPIEHTIEQIPSTRGPTKSVIIKPKEKFQNLSSYCESNSIIKNENDPTNIENNEIDVKFEKKKLRDEKIQMENLKSFNLYEKDLIESFEEIYPDLYEMVFSLNGNLIDQESGCESVVHEKLQSDLNFNDQSI